MQNYSKVTVRLTPRERAALVESAQRALRAPRDQARYLLRQALGLTDGETGPMSPTHDASSATVEAGNRPGGAAG